MVLDHGYVEFVEDWGRGKAGVPEAGIIEAARQSTQGGFRSWDAYRVCERCGSFDAMNAVLWESPDKCEDGCAGTMKEYPRGDMGLLSFLFNNKPQHATPFEFAGMVLEVQAPIFVFREWHRHRTQSYNEMSARYAPLPDLNYMPTVERILMANQAGKNKQAQAVQGAREITAQDAEFYIGRLKVAYEQDQKLYEWALSMGVPKEVARIHLPVGRYSRMRAQANLRNWLAFMTLRADPNAQWEIRQFAFAVGDFIQERFPRTWGLFAARREAELGKGEAK